MSNFSKILKFGGTSIGSPIGFQNILSIVHQQSEPVCVVVSACAGVTDLLYDLAWCAAKGNQSDIQKRLDSAYQIHRHLLRDLFPDSSIQKHIEQRLTPWFDQLRDLLQGICYLGEITERQTARVVAYGELLSSTLLAAALEISGIAAEWWDIRKIFRAYPNRWIGAELDEKQTGLLLQQLLAARKQSQLPRVVVTQGFIAGDAAGRSVVLGRGASDYSAAVLGALLRVDEVQIWTDVSGVYTADPRYVPDAVPIPSLSFSHVRQMALYGAKVVHPDALLPVEKQDIPVRILNTFDPSGYGTLLQRTNVLDETVALLSVCLLQSCSLQLLQEESGGSAWIAQKFPDKYCLVTRDSGDGESVDLVACIGNRLLDDSDYIARIFRSIAWCPIRFFQANSANSVCVIAVPKGEGQKVLNALHSICLESVAMLKGE